jgi:filamentous hemagglutinin family protein
MDMIHSRARRFAPALTPIAAALISIGLCSPSALAAPQGGTVQAGAATIQQSGPRTQITQTSHRAIIDWRAFGVGANEQVAFLQPSRQSATLNRVTGDQLSSILGRIDATGQVYLVNPHGIVIGNGAQINVGGLIASTANISNDNFMQGRLVFDQPGDPGARIVHQGTITAADSGLVALVAPSVQNDGVIQARLGKVAIGAGDTFTIDLQGDGLINLALSPQHREQLQATGGHPLISQSGRIEADGGQVVLITAPLAAAVLDEVINMGGSIRADSVAQQGGRILLFGSGGKVNVDGTLSARGAEGGTQGGAIDVVGDVVQLAGSARADAGGQAGGGVIHVGGDWQGQGGTYRAKETRVDAGAGLNADAGASGNGGEVVLWSDGNTAFAGQISARGGMASGNGGRVEVSGKGSLDFAGDVVANAAHGEAGLLLLDPAYLNIGASEAGLINRVLRTGTSTRLLADVDITVNSMIDGRGGRSGGGLSMSAGRDVALNQTVVTNGGAINITARGAIHSAAGTGLFSLGGGISLAGGAGIVSGDVAADGGSISLASGSGPIRLDGNLVTTGAATVAVIARNGSIDASPGTGIYAGTGKVTMAAGNTASATRLDAAQIATSGGAVDLSSGTGGMGFRGAVTTRGGAFAATSGGALDSGQNGIFTLIGPIALTGSSVNVAGPLVTSGDTTLRSTSGYVRLNSPVGKENGNLTIQSAGAVDLNSAILNIASGALFSVVALSDIYVDAPIEGREGTARAGAVSLTSRNGNVRLNSNIVTNGGAIDISAGAAVLSATEKHGSQSTPRLVSGGGSINVSGTAGVTLNDVQSLIVARNQGSVVDQIISGGSISIASAEGNINLNGAIQSFGRTNEISNDAVISLWAPNGEIIKASSYDVPTAYVGNEFGRIEVVAGTRIGSLDLLAERVSATVSNPAGFIEDTLVFFNTLAELRAMSFHTTHIA